MFFFIFSRDPSLDPALSGVRPYSWFLVLLLHLVTRTDFPGTVLTVGFYVLYLFHVNSATGYCVVFTHLLVFLILSTGIDFLLLSTRTYLIFNNSNLTY